MQLRERFLVLRTVGELLGLDDGVETCDADTEIAVVEDTGVIDEVFIAAWLTWSRHSFHDVEGAGVGSPVGEGQLFEDRVDLDRESGRLLVGKAGDAETGFELAQRCCEMGKVVFLLADQTVAVFGGPGGTVELGRTTADDEVFDTVAIEDFDDSSEVRFGGRRQDPSPSRCGSTTAPRRGAPAPRR